MYPLCFVGDITLIYQELKAVHLRTLNRTRAELLLSQYLHTREVRPPPATCDSGCTCALLSAALRMGH